MQPKITEKVVKKAIDIGYRHIDTSFSYGNEKEIGKAINAKIAEHSIKREEIFVTTKVIYIVYLSYSLCVSCVPLHSLLLESI